MRVKMRTIQVCANYNLISVSEYFFRKCYANFMSLLRRNLSRGKRLNKVVYPSTRTEPDSSFVPLFCPDWSFALTVLHNVGHQPQVVLHQNIPGLQVARRAPLQIPLLLLRLQRTREGAPAS